jgi:hypothetical protein
MAAFFGFPNSVIMSEVSLTKRVTTQSKDPAFVCSQHCRGREFSPRNRNRENASMRARRMKRASARPIPIRELELPTFVGLRA